MVFQVNQESNSDPGRDYVWLTNVDCDNQNYEWNDKSGNKWPLLFDQEQKILTHAISSDYYYFKKDQLLIFSEDGDLTGIIGPSDNSEHKVYTLRQSFSEPFDRNISNCRKNTVKKGCLLSMNLQAFGDQDSLELDEYKWRYPQNIQLVYNDNINIRNPCQLEKWGIVTGSLFVLYFIVFMVFKKYR